MQTPRRRLWRRVVRGIAVTTRATGDTANARCRCCVIICLATLLVFIAVVEDMLLLLLLLVSLF